MIVLVCGGRSYHNTKHVFQVLDALHQDKPIIEVWHGDASGADTAAGMWADVRKVPQRAFPARWGQHGRAAGPIRNGEMASQLALMKVDKLCVAFPGGPGTEDMVSRARAHGIEVMRSVDPEHWVPTGPKVHA